MTKRTADVLVGVAAILLSKSGLMMKLDGVAQIISKNKSAADFWR